jgi:glycosyltransferase involved in cell wall biosynthesis
MIRLLQLARAIRQIGYRPILLYQDFVGGDMGAMRAFWGADLHVVPYRAESVKWQVKRMVRGLLDPSSRAYRWSLKLQAAARRFSFHRDHEEFRIRLDDLYDDNLAPHISEICEREKPCAAICLDVFMTRSLEAVPTSVLRILDTNDLYAVGRDHANGAEENLWVNLSLEDELRGYRRADLIWAIQPRDEEKIRKAAPDLNVITVGHPVDLVPPDFEMSLRSREILLVASKHYWNIRGLRWFAAEVYPLLRDLLPERNVVIAGDIADVLEAEMPFKFPGRVADLTAVYRGARVVFSPILGGAGLKIKNIEPMGHGKAVVSTRSAATGLEAAENRAFLVGEDAAGFAEAIRRVMQDDELCRRLMEGAIAFAQEWNEQVLAALRKSFEMQRDPARIRQLKELNH